ncbi:hypothetical protein ACQ4M3_09610 [Leptolyngbya sp. AN03gr2]|uniref:hypothetical protein n=1 Tax=Leptolyngbya sp. AN03gr2 TaxID=3423364 RepID=UPI003D3239D0
MSAADLIHLRPREKSGHKKLVGRRVVAVTQILYVGFEIPAGTSGVVKGVSERFGNPRVV